MPNGQYVGGQYIRGARRTYIVKSVSVSGQDVTLSVWPGFAMALPRAGDTVYPAITIRAQMEDQTEFLREHADWVDPVGFNWVERIEE